VLYNGPMMAFFEGFIGEPVRHYDFTWYRSIFPHRYGTAAHSDIVYMGRGERERLFTAWTPLGDLDLEQGGLAILEGSNNHDGLRDSYWKRDVDAYCANREDQRDEWGRGLNGVLAQDVGRIRGAFGGRWLTSEYRAGDVIIFSIYTVHCGTDNNSDRIRLSSDSRYQPASKPADERWIGPNPMAHGAGAKRGLIC
jgi:ectoine hydroxylase-related dioxygenase (phytanoyl-CoA dioxygenase family)